MNLRKQITQIWVASVLVLLAGAANAEVVVVVSSRSALSALSQHQVADIFLGKTSRLPDGQMVLPVDQPEGSAVRGRFYLDLVGKSPSQLKAHWSKIIFTGKGQPPREVSGNDLVKKVVAGNPGVIGYIESTAVDSSVKPVLVVK